VNNIFIFWLLPARFHRPVRSRNLRSLRSTTPPASMASASGLSLLIHGLLRILSHNVRLLPPRLYPNER
jgi:hypothetical protein